MKTEPDESETRNYEAEAARIKPLLTNPDSRLAKLADRYVLLLLEIFKIFSECTNKSKIIP